MFETVLGRLQALAQAEGFDPQPGTVINGELRAYAAGIALVYDQLTDAREGAYAATAAGENLWRWLTVRGLLPGDTLQETRQKLLARRQMPWGDFSLAGFQQALSDLCGADATYHCTDGNLELVIPAAARANLGRLLRDWVPPFLYAYLSGSGRTWNALDADAVPYAVFDRAALPFDILDTEDEHEQYQQNHQLKTE